MSARYTHCARPTAGLCQRATRTCLCCGRGFPSEGAWNRLCGRCKSRNDQAQASPRETHPAHVHLGNSAGGEVGDGEI